MRTPIERNGGWNRRFSAADPAKLYAPLIEDPVYGYAAVRVLSQTNHSALSGMGRITAVRKMTPARKRIDWVSIQPITGILAYVRQLGDETIRVVNHLSNAAQAVGLDLRRVNIRIERFGKNIFPRVVKCPTC